MKKSIFPTFVVLIFFFSSHNGNITIPFGMAPGSISPSWLSDSSRQENGDGLFIPLDGLSAQAASDDPTILRSQLVSIRLDLLPDPSTSLFAQSAQEQHALQLNLFSDVSLVARLDHLEENLPGMTSWVGSIDGEEGSEAILVIGEDGVVTGNIALPTAFYEIRYVSSGVHAIYEIDQSAFPEETAVPVGDPTGSSPAVQPIAAQADDGSVIDVMIIYTSAARSAAGGTSAMHSAVNLMVTETNNAYANSGITQRLNLVYTNEVIYSETGNITTDLENATFNEIANIHDWRDDYAADLVILIVENGGAYCGIAWLMQSVSSSFAPYGYSVVDLECATGYYSVAHEMGHNMGATHDWYVDSSTAPYIYNKGYVYLPGRWRTIMAYDDVCEDNGFYCTRLPYFSNPNKTYSGVPMGVAGEVYPGADNRRVLNNTAYTVANFRLGLAAPTNLAASVNHMAMQINLSWIDRTSTETGFSVQRKITGSSTWGQIGTTAANTPSYQDTIFSCNTAYDYRVTAYNSSQSSSPSNIVSVTSPICPPSGLTGTALSQERVRLQWTDNSVNETGFRVQRSPNGVSSWIQVSADLPANATSYTDYPLTCGTSNYYRILVFNSTSATPSEIIPASSNSCGPPPQPAGISTAPASTIMIHITWTDILDDETYYIIYRSPNGTGSWSQIGTTAENVTSYYDQGLEWDTRYYYRIVAANSYGSSTACPSSCTSTYRYGLFSPIIVK